MSDATEAAAAALLSKCRQLGQTIAALPPEMRPNSRAEGYAIQARLERDRAAPLYGWKIAATSAAGQAHIGVDRALAGRLFAEHVIADGGLCPLGTNQMRVAEVEFAFQMGKALPARAKPYSLDQVLEAVSTLHPAIELPDSRLKPFETAGAAHLIADNACASYFVLGPATRADWRAIDLSAHAVAGRINEGEWQHGTGGDVLGDPRIALTWLANELSSVGSQLEAGQVVTTGTCVNPMTIAPGDRILGDLGAIGRVSLSISS